MNGGDKVDKSSDVFLNSIGNKKKKDLLDDSSSKKNRFDFGKLLRILIIIACLGVFIYCIVTLVSTVLAYSKSQNYYDDLAVLWNDDISPYENLNGDLLFCEKDYQNQPAPDYSEAKNVSDNQIGYVQIDSDEMLRIKAKLSALFAQNNDLVAWITIPGTIVNYPVVHTTADKEDFYLNHDFKGDYNIAGTIFIDARNSGDLSKNYNTVIYGHNVNAGTMFSKLSDYFTKSYYEEHREILIYTMKGVFVYEIFNVSKVSSKGDYIKTYFPTAQSFIEFATRRARDSVFVDDDLVFTGSDRIITLSTCTNSHNNAKRYCIHARLVEIRK